MDTTYASAFPTDNTEQPLGILVIHNNVPALFTRLPDAEKWLAITIFKGDTVTPKDYRLTTKILAACGLYSEISDVLRQVGGK